MILFVPWTIYAQVPSGLILWLQADSGIVQTQGIVSQWIDQSGKGNSVSQNNSSSQPLLTKNVLNGHSAVKFHGNGEYFIGPSVFPHSKDYTIIAVVRIDDTTAVNNIISGTDHAFYFAGDMYPRVVHGDFLFIAKSSLKIDSNFAIITVRYSEANAQAKIYVNGQSGDSLFIKSNSSDSLIYVGAFRGSYTLNGAIAELTLFDRQLSEKERAQFESSLRAKYNIPLGKAVPKPDSTFFSLPVNLQLYPRGSDDSAIVPVSGTIYNTVYDSIYLDVFKNGLLDTHQSAELLYSEGKAPFTFAPKIHAELSEYHFLVRLKRNGSDTIIADRNNITCGDVYFICGESNSTFGYYTVPYQNEFCRTFGVNFSQNIRDTMWALSTAALWGDGPSVSGWGLMLQKHLVEQEQMPSCIIDGGLSGTVLIHHLRDTLFPLSLETIYGRLLYRAQKANITSAVKAIIWYHGELDLVDHYYDNFKTLYRNWHEDFPGFQKCYVIQLRPAFCVDLYDQPLRELFRTMQDSLPGITSISSTMFPNQDGCHFHDDGFSGISDQIFPTLAYDFYGSTDTIGIISPNIKKAFFTTPQKNEIALIFTPHNCGISSTNDTTVGGIFATLKDYFYPDDELGKIESIRFNGDSVFLKLFLPSKATSISHIPDRYYNGSDSVFYEGPWLKSSRGIGALIFWHFPIDSWQNSVNTPKEAVSISLEVLPNLVENITHLTFTLPTSEIVTLSIFDVFGKRVAELVKGYQNEGLHDITYDATGLSAGEYFCRLQTGNTNLTKKIILTK